MRTAMGVKPAIRFALLGAALMMSLLLLISTNAYAAKAQPASCAATRAKPNTAWARAKFALLKTKKYQVPVPASIRRDACTKNPLRPHGNLSGAPDLHRAWRVTDPLNRKGALLLVVPGARGIWLFQGGGAIGFYTQRCVFDAGRQPLGFNTIGSAVTGKATFIGVVPDTVTAVQSSGGQGTRTAPDGTLLPVEVSVKPLHNVYHFVAPNGAAQLTFFRSGALPPIVELVYQSAPIPTCLPVSQVEGWLTPTLSPPAGL